MRLRLKARVFVCASGCSGPLWALSFSPPVWTERLDVTLSLELSLWRALLFVYSEDSNCPWCLVRFPSGARWRSEPRPDLGFGLFTKAAAEFRGIWSRISRLYNGTQSCSCAPKHHLRSSGIVFTSMLFVHPCLFSVYWLNLISIMPSDSARIQTFIMQHSYQSKTKGPWIPLLYGASKS